MRGLPFEPYPFCTLEGDVHDCVCDVQHAWRGERIIPLELEAHPEAHPWQQLAGMFADDPDWDAFQESIQEYREAIDRGLAEE